MKQNKFRASDIAIGDVIFFSTKGIDNLDKYWKVTAIMDKEFLTVTGEGGKIVINLKDVQLHRPVQKKGTIDLLSI